MLLFLFCVFLRLILVWRSFQGFPFRIIEISATPLLFWRTCCASLSSAAAGSNRARQQQQQEQRIVSHTGILAYSLHACVPVCLCVCVYQFH